MPGQLFKLLLLLHLLHWALASSPVSVCAKEGQSIIIPCNCHLPKTALITWALFFRRNFVKTVAQRHFIYNTSNAMQFYDISFVDGSLTIHNITKGYSYVCTKHQASGLGNSIQYKFQFIDQKTAIGSIPTVTGQMLSLPCKSTRQRRIKTIWKRFIAGMDGHRTFVTVAHMLHNNNRTYVTKDHQISPVDGTLTIINIRDECTYLCETWHEDGTHDQRGYAIKLTGLSVSSLEFGYIHGTSQLKCNQGASIKWYRKLHTSPKCEEKLATGPKFQTEANGNLLIHRVTLFDDADYECRTQHQITSSVSLRVLDISGGRLEVMQHYPQTWGIVTQNNTILPAASTLELKATANNFRVPPQIVWWKNNVQLQKSKFTDINTYATKQNDNLYGTMQSNLVLTLSPEDDGATIAVSLIGPDSSTWFTRHIYQLTITAPAVVKSSGRYVWMSPVTCIVIMAIGIMTLKCI